MEGSFDLSSISDGIDVLNEDVTVRFDGFTDTIPAGSFFRDDADQGFRFGGASGGITRVTIRDDGKFEVDAQGLDLSSINLSSPVHFSLRIDDDFGETTISLDSEGRFRLVQSSDP